MWLLGFQSSSSVVVHIEYIVKWRTMLVLDFNNLLAYHSYIHDTTALNISATLLTRGLGLLLGLTVSFVLPDLTVVRGVVIYFRTSEGLFWYIKLFCLSTLSPPRPLTSAPKQTQVCLPPRPLSPLYTAHEHPRQPQLLVPIKVYSLTKLLKILLFLLISKALQN